MKYRFIVFVTLFATTLRLNGQSLEWVKQLGGLSSDKAVSVSTDGAGNVFTTGYFQNTVDFDPGTGTFNLSSFGGLDIYISKLDASGNFVWARQLGGVSNDEGLSVTADDMGNVYATGYFQNTVDFDPGPGIVNLTSSGSRDIFVCKLDASGNFLWAKQLGGSGLDYSYSISTDTSGNVYTTGFFYNTADFDPGAATFNLTSVGSRDIYISKLDPSGNFLWAKHIGGSGFDNGFSIVTDAIGNVYTTGAFQDTVDFDPGAGILDLSSNGLSDIYISKLDPSGNFVWAGKMGGANTDLGVSITIGASGYIYTTGYFYGTVDFNPGAGVFNLSSFGSRDIFISKFDPSGNFVWAKQLGGTSDDRGFSITTDALDNIYTTGIFENTADFDPGAGNMNLTASGNRDVFISKLNASGNFVWAIQLGGLDDDVGNSITANAIGTIYTIGTFENTADFDLGIGNVNLSSAGGTDAFIHKISQCPSSTSTDVITACNSYTWIDGNSYTASTTIPIYTILGGAASGCDSLVLLNLTINNSSLFIDSIIACNAYTWIDGNSYTSSTNTPIYTISGGASNGCDSLISLNLTINNSTAGLDSITACNTYTWIDGNSYTSSTNTPIYTISGGASNGCDSLISLNLTINNSTAGLDSITACNVYTWIDGNSYTSSTNTPTYTISGGASNGCDSLVSLGLVIHTVSDVSTTTTGITISANNTAATYQWLDCANNYSPISGAINASFTATVNGMYAVELRENTCIDTSICVNINSIGIIENSFGSRFSISPNPTSGPIQILLGKEYTDLSIVIRNALGQELMRKSYSSTNKIDLSIEGDIGIYSIEIMGNGDRALFRVIKE